MDDFSQIQMTPTASRPLLGLTVLAVEDSRFASDALRLLCLKSGARIRRADCLASAHRHLRVFRPTVVIVDLGLPDGSGLELIRELSLASPRIAVLIATSGDDSLAHAARAAGADTFLSKPVASLALFQTEILKCLPSDQRPSGILKPRQDRIEPDSLAYKDDLVHAAEVLSGTDDKAQIDYALQFLDSIAQSANDLPLARAVESTRKGGSASTLTKKLLPLIETRLSDEQAVNL